MDLSEQHRWLAGRFEENRAHLRAVAYRMLGSSSEADDVVQEAWLRLNRSVAGEIENLSGWLTTVVSRICLDMLRSRSARREDASDAIELQPNANQTMGMNPEQEAILADSVGLALLVVLDRLQPAERIAFVLHDLFAFPFEEIAPILGRSPGAARQLASRARRRVQGQQTRSRSILAEHARVVKTFLTALRAGDLAGVLAILDPDVVRLADAAAAPPPAPIELRGAERVASESMRNVARARSAAVASVDGSAGIVVVQNGRVTVAIRCKVVTGKIIHMSVIADPEHLARLRIGLIGTPEAGERPAGLP